MVRKQNERTILLQYRIIPLSLPTKTLFLILASRPLSTRLGAFSFPETFSHKFFPKFFPIKPRRLFSVFLVRKIMFSWGELFSTFLVRKIMGVDGPCRSPNGGGYPFLYALHIANRHALLSSGLHDLPEACYCPLVVCFLTFQHFIYQTGIYWLWLFQSPATSDIRLLSDPWVLHSLSISTPWVLRHSTMANFQTIRGKKGQKWNFSCLILSHLGKIGDNKVQNPKIFLKVREGERLEMCPACLTFGVSTGGRWCRLFVLFCWR